MIARALTFSVLFAVAAPPLAAQTLAVRAGEHGDYSRLVIAGPPDGWRIATSDRKVEITIPGASSSFDLSEVVDKRKAHRVLNARVIDNADSRSLVLSLTCDCAVRTSKSPDNAIVIDIVNPTPAVLAEADPAPAPVSDAARNSATATPESMRAARDRMIALLAEARHQGVVQLKTDDAGEEEKVTAATPVTPAAATPDDVQSVADAAPDASTAPLHEQAEAAADRAPTPLTAQAGEPALAGCADASLFDELEDDNRIDYAAITGLRQRFETSESDAEREDIAATLALAYIHLEFFEEASAIASARAYRDDANMVAIGALADAAAGAKAPARRALNRLAHCGPLFELANAAVAPADDETVKPMTTQHLDALNGAARALRAPLAEALGLAAVDKGEKTIAQEFFNIARDARGAERSAALAILEAKLLEAGLASAAADEATTAGVTPPAAPTQEIIDIAQTPGPLQAKALALLADDYQRRADAAYEGLLDDIAAQAGRRASSLSEARASFSGAKALAEAGRLREGIRVLEAAAESAPAAREASESLARAMIMNALLSDDQTRLEAVASFFDDRDFLEDQTNGEINIAVAQELAAYGASALVDDAVRSLPAPWRAQADAARALSRLNAGDPQGALDIAASGQASDALAVIAVRAHEQLNDRGGTVAAIRSGLRNGARDNELADAAWRAGDWPLTAQAFAQVPKQDRSSATAKRTGLAALNSGAGELPLGVRETLASEPDALTALAHMFKKAPAVNFRAIDLLSDFSTGVGKETDFMQSGLGAGGD